MSKLLSMTQKFLVHRRKFIWLILLVLGYAATGFFIAPWVLKPIIEQRLNSTLNGTLSIGEMRVNPFSLSTSIQDVLIKDSDGDEVFEFKELYVNLQTRSILEWTPVFSEVSLTEPSLRIGYSKGGELNIGELFREESSEGKSSESTSVPALYFDQISIRGGRLQYFDAEVDKNIEFVLTPLKLEVNSFSSIAPGESEFSISAVNLENNTVTLQGKVSASPLSVYGAIDIKVQEPGPAIDYLASNLHIKIPESELSIKSDFSIKAEADGVNVTATSKEFLLRNLKILDARDGSSLGSVQELSLGLDFDLKEKLIRISDLSAGPAELSVVIGKDGTLNLSSLRKSSTSAPPLKATEQSEEDWKIEVLRSKLSGFKVSYINRMLDNPSPQIFEKISLELADLIFGKDGRTSGVVVADLPEGGSLRSSITGSISPLNLSCDLDIKGLSLPVLIKEVSPGISPTFKSGASDLSGRLELKAGDSIVTTFSGGMTISKLLLTEPDGKAELLGVSSIKAEEIALDTSQGKFTAKAFNIEEPSLSLRFSKEASLNLTTAFKTNTPETKPREGGSRLSFEVQTVKVKNGRFSFRDESVSPAFRTHLSGIDGNLLHFSSEPSKRFPMTFKATLDQYGKISYKGSLAPASSFPLQDGKLEVSEYNLTALTPYSNKFFGRSIESGKLIASIENKTDKETISGLNKFQLDRFYLGDQSGPSTVNLPISTALSVLRDSDGQLFIDIPVTGSLNSPSLNYRKLLYKGLQDLVIEIATSPISIISSLYSFDSAEMSHVDFEPKSNKALPTEAQKLALIEKILFEKQALRLEVRGSSAIQLDGGSEGQTALDEDLAELAAQRASFVRDTILKSGRIEPSRVYILSQIVVEPTPENTVPVQLALRSG